MIYHQFTVAAGRHPQRITQRAQQRGSTLLIGLIILILLTLMAISAINATSSNVQVVGNAQFREEAAAAAQQEIEKVISTNFTALPVASTATVSFGAASYTVQVEKPVCTSSVAIPSSELNPAVAADAACLGSAALNNTGVVTAAGTSVGTAQAWCYKQKWDIRSTVADAGTSANVALHQGVFVRVPAGTGCP